MTVCALVTLKKSTVGIMCQRSPRTTSRQAANSACSRLASATCLLAANNGLVDDIGCWRIAVRNGKGVRRLQREPGVMLEVNASSDFHGSS